MTTSRRGFTMIELLVYLGIFTIIALVYSTFILQVTTNARTVRGSETVQQNVQVLSTQISQDIRLANSVILAENDRIDLDTDAGPVTYLRAADAVTRNGVTVSPADIIVTAFTAALWHGGVTWSINATDTSGEHPVQAPTTVVPRAVILAGS